MNPNSMEWVEDTDGNVYQMPTWPVTEEEPPQRTHRFTSDRLGQLQAQEQDAENFLNDLLGDPPSRPICGWIKRHIILGQAKEAWDLWKQAEQHVPLLPQFESEEVAMSYFAHNWKHFAKGLPNLHGALNGLAGAIYDHEVQTQIIQSQAAHRARDYQMRKERAKYEHDVKADLAAAEEHSRHAALQRAQNAERREREPQKIGITGSPKRVRAEQAPRPLFTPQEELRRQHAHLQPRDKQGRFTDSDSKGKGEL